MFELFQTPVHGRSPSRARGKLVLVIPQTAALLHQELNLNTTLYQYFA
jgi:hypothetical protein